MNDSTRLLLMRMCLNMQDIQRLSTLIHLLGQTESVPGVVLEMGCHFGYTAALLNSFTQRPFRLFDSFSGLPSPGGYDSSEYPFVEGRLKANINDVYATFIGANLKCPTVTCGVVGLDSLLDLSGASISFAHIDLDLYEGTKAALKLVWPKMSKGGIVVVDDYTHPKLPGVQKAVHHFVLGMCDKPKIHEGHIHAWMVKE